MQGRNTLAYQPTKVAAMEGLWEHDAAAPPMTLIAWPDMEAEANLFAIDIPNLASVYLTHSWNGEIQGLKAVPPADRPYVPIVFFAFRIMVGIGIDLLATAITGAVLRWRGRLFDTRWFQLLAMASTPSGVSGRAWRLDDHRGGAPAVGHLRSAPNGRRCCPGKR